MAFNDKLNTEATKWEKIRKAVTNLDTTAIKQLGTTYKKPMLRQTGVTIPEVQNQILRMAPGNHPLVGPLLLDLADKLDNN